MYELVLFIIIRAMFVYSRADQRKATWQVWLTPTVIKRMCDFSAHPHVSVNAINKSCWRRSIKNSSTRLKKIKKTSIKGCFRDFKERKSIRQSWGLNASDSKWSLVPVRMFKLFLETSNFRINRCHFFFVRLGREVRVESPWSYSSKLEFPTQPPLIWHFPENSGRGERGQAMQDILTGCEDGRTAAGSRGERSVELKGAIDLCGCVRVWNRHGQEACED